MLLRCRYGDRERIYQSSGHELTIGRPSRLPVEVDLSADRSVSQGHARLFYDLGTWWIEDLDSRNGSFVNGSRVLKPVALSPGDTIRLWTTTIRAEFFITETAPPAGVVQAGLPVEETGELSRISEDQRLETLGGVARIVAESRGKQSMLEGFLRELRPTFRSAERITIALVEDREIVPRAFSPMPQSYISFTLARRAIVSQQALHWVPILMRGAETPIPQSLAATGGSPVRADGHRPASGGRGPSGHKGQQHPVHRPRLATGIFIEAKDRSPPARRYS